MSKKSKNQSQTPAKPTSKTEGSASREESLSNLSAIIATEKDTKMKRLHELVMERIKGLKKRP